MNDLDRLDLYPNLGAEERDDWRGYQHHPPVRSAAHLWTLLFGRNARLRIPEAKGLWMEYLRDALWPRDLGLAPEAPVFEWLGQEEGPVAWFKSEEIVQQIRQESETPLSGPTPEIVSLVHDKAFAARAALRLGFAPRTLAPLIEILDADTLNRPEQLLSHLEAQLETWPDWTERSFTLKPRMGSSGRGRVGGRERIDSPALRGALPRLAASGGAIFEPWLPRVGDYSVTLRIPGNDRADRLPTILGSLEMWSTPAGVYLGHLGEVDSRGRIFSGDPADESLRAEAAALGSLAGNEGFFGVCGVDSFRYREAREANGTPVDGLRHDRRRASRTPPRSRSARVDAR